MVIPLALKEQYGALFGALRASYDDLEALKGINHLRTRCLLLSIFGEDARICLDDLQRLWQVDATEVSEIVVLLHERALINEGGAGERCVRLHELQRYFSART